MYEETNIAEEAEALFEDLIESAYLEGLIDGDAHFLAYYWLATNHQTKQ